MGQPLKRVRSSVVSQGRSLPPAERGGLSANLSVRRGEGGLLQVSRALGSLSRTNGPAYYYVALPREESE